MPKGEVRRQGSVEVLPIGCNVSNFTLCYVTMLFMSNQIMLMKSGVKNQNAGAAMNPTTCNLENEKIPGNHSERPVAGSLHFPFKIIHEIFSTA